MAPLSLSAKASTSRLTMLSGLSQGMKPSNCRVLQPSKMLVFLVVLVLGLVFIVNVAVLRKGDMVVLCPSTAKTVVVWNLR